MKPPAADDVPADFLSKRRFAEAPSAEYLHMARDIADHNLDVLFYRVKDLTLSA
jgi:hypothetical protein